MPTKKRLPAGHELSGEPNTESEPIQLKDMTFMNLRNGNKHHHHVRLTNRKHFKFPYEPGQLVEGVKRDVTKIVKHFGEYNFPTTLFRFGVVSGVHTGKMQRLCQTGVADQAADSFDMLWEKSRMGDLSLSFLESSGVVGIEMQCFILQKDFFWPQWRLSGPLVFQGDWNDTRVYKSGSCYFPAHAESRFLKLSASLLLLLLSIVVFTTLHYCDVVSTSKAVSSVLVAALTTSPYIIFEKPGMAVKAR